MAVIKGVISAGKETGISQICRDVLKKKKRVKQ